MSQLFGELTNKNALLESILLSEMPVYQKMHVCYRNTIDSEKLKICKIKSIQDHRVDRAGFKTKILIFEVG
jgi:hypothetical protein